MKKKLLYVSFLFFLFAITVKVPSFATFYISNFDINADVNPSGDMRVKEIITYYTDETVNGLTRKILTTNQFNKTNSASGIELLGVYVQGQPCERVLYGNIGDNMVYEYTINGSNEYNIKLYSPFNIPTKTIEYDYILKDVAVKYNDIGELYWNFIGDEWDSRIENLVINITFPELAAKSKSYVYGHGSDDGTFTKYGNRITLMANGLSEYQALDARILFDREAISDSTKIVNKDVLERFINEEEGFYEKQEEKMVFGNFSVKTLAEILTIILLVIFVIIYFFDSIRYNGKKIKYFREIPDNLSPEIIQFLYYGKVIKSSFYIAFLNLIKLGVFKLEETTNLNDQKIKKIIYNKEEKVNLTKTQSGIKNTIRRFLEKDKEKNIESLDISTLSEKMKKSTGSGYRTFSKNIQSEIQLRYGKQSTILSRKMFYISLFLMIVIILVSTISAIQVSSSSELGEWITCPVVLIIVSLCFSPIFKVDYSESLFIKIAYIFLFVVFQYVCIEIMYYLQIIWLYIPYLLCFIFIKYDGIVKEYPREERETIEKIKGLRRYIKDYSMLRSKDGIVENIALWEDYFILAIALGLNKKTVNYFYDYGKEQPSTNLGMSIHGTSSYYDFHYPIYSSFYSYQKSYTYYSNSSSGRGSSFSGSSGGFSGGSSSGGGGGRRRWRGTLLK